MATKDYDHIKLTRGTWTPINTSVKIRGTDATDIPTGTECSIQNASQDGDAHIVAAIDADKPVSGDQAERGGVAGPHEWIKSGKGTGVTIYGTASGADEVNIHVSHE